VSSVLGIDHVIITVPDLDEATARFAGVLGFHVSGGGTHPQFGTANRIIVLGDEYIELLAAQPGEQPRGLVGGLLASGEGRLACILSVDDPRSFAAEARSRGLQVTGPDRGRLEAAAGFSRGWRTVTMTGADLPGLPFVICHDAGGDERRRLLAGPAGLQAHENGVCRVAGITLALADCHAAAARMQQVLGLAPAGEGRDSMLAADTVSTALPSGATIVAASPADPGVGPVAAVLARDGESMLSVTLAVQDLPAAVAMLRGRGVGVRVHEPGGVLVAAQLNMQSTYGARIGLVRA
jgi:catechol 2,3-dioxygenase-like lactoylglutathione lyase family enzyme